MSSDGKGQRKIRKPTCPKCGGCGWTFSLKPVGADRKGSEYTAAPCKKCNPKGSRPNPHDKERKS